MATPAQKIEDLPAVAAKPTVLLVDDDRSSLLMLELRIAPLGYNVVTAVNGADAYAKLRSDPAAVDIVVTDRMMPLLDGLGLTRRLKREAATKHIPVVMLTGATDASDISEGIEAGAFYYLTKPPEETLVASVLRSAMEDVKRQNKLRADLSNHQAAFANLEVVKFRLRLPHEVDPVVSLLASMQDNPDRALQGIYELVQNAVEHGVLRFGYEAKARHLADGTWRAALAERAADPQYASGSVEVTSMRSDKGIHVIVKDDGPGFDWKRFIRTDPSRSTAPCGRGISRAVNGVFDKLVYNETGNQAVALVAPAPRIAW